MTNTEPVPMAKWRKDHWSLLAYVECRDVDNGGKLHYPHLRIKTRTASHMGTPMDWKPEWGTRIADDVQLEHHDDLLVLDDLHAEGLIEPHVEGCGVHRRVHLTETGRQICAALRAHKADGGQFYEFRWTGA